MSTPSVFAAKLPRRNPSLMTLIERLEARLFLSTDVLTWHYDNTRQGANTAETVLTPSNVNTTSFGKLFSLPVDGYVYAQPLIKTGVNVTSYGTRDLLLVATEHDSVYAFDAGGNNPAQGYLWKRSFLTGPSGTTVTTVPSADVQTNDIVPEIGITGTPVIDGATNTLYVVAKTKETTNGVTTYVQRLHAINLADGTEKVTPVVIGATISGTGDGGTTVTFNPLRQNQRSALTLANGVVYINWSSHGDQGLYHGWVMGYSASTLQQMAVFCNTPDTNDGGIWMAGGGMSVDSSGNLYVVGGNAPFNANTGGRNYGDSAIKLSSALSVLSYFTPYNQGSLSSADNDMGTSTMLLLPDQSGSVTHVAVTCDKTGRIYLLNRDSLGGYNSSSNNDVGQIDIGNSVHNNFAYFNGHLYVFADGTNGRAYPISGGVISSFDSSTSVTFGLNGYNGAGGTPSISANGTSNGIVWVSDNFAYGSSGAAVLRAFTASNLGTQLWNSSQASGGRDTAGAAVKFTTPVVANGMVYLGGQGVVTVYGLLPTNPPGIPTNLSAQAISSSQINLSWTAPSGAVTSYNIYRSTTPGGEGTTPYQTGITSTSFSDTNVSPNTTYYYTVAAVNSAGTSAQSGEAFATTPAGAAFVQVPLSSYYNQIGIYNNGSTFSSSGGLDGVGYAISSNLVGISVRWNGVPFVLGPAGANDAVRGGAGVTVPLPSGQYSSLQLLGMSTYGNSPSQTFTLTYSDNTTQTFTQGMSDWYTPQSYAGESIATAMAYRLVYNGTQDNRTFNIYGYSFTLNNGKTVKSITLPNNNQVHILAMNLLGGTPVTVPAAPTNLSAQAVSSSQINLSWTAPAGPVDSYNIYRSATPSGEGTTPYRTGITGTSLSDTGLAANTTYYYTVAAVNSAGPSSQSAEAFATTQNMTPSSTVQVPLGSYFNQIGIYANGSTFSSSGGFDGVGYAISSSLIDGSVNWNGNTFVIGPAGANDAIRGGAGITVALPAGQYTSLQFLGASTYGNSPGQTFVVTYTDNTTTSFTQSLSDWHTPQGYAGESAALTMAYRNVYTGTQDNRTFYVYGYSFTLDSTRTVKSITIPNNVDVHVLAMDLVGASTPVTPPGIPTGVNAQAVSSSQINLSWTAPSGVVSSYSIYRSTIPGGEGSTPYRTGITGTSFSDTGLAASTAYYYTVQAVNSAGPSLQSAEASATTLAPSTITQVPLGSYYNRIGIYNDGATFSNTGGIDGSGSALSGTLLDGTQTWNGNTFTIGPAGSSDVVRGGAGVVITLPAGQYSSLQLLALGVNGNQPSQTFVVTYTDGTSTTFTQSISDWFTPQGYAGESAAITMAYRDLANGTRDSRTFRVYGYTLALNSAKTVSSITMPSNGNVYLVAADLVP